MSNEWFELAWINFTKAILHGQYVDDGVERMIEQTLTADQIEQVYVMKEKHEAAMNNLLRSFLP